MIFCKGMKGGPDVLEKCLRRSEVASRHHGKQSLTPFSKHWFGAYCAPRAGETETREEGLGPWAPSPGRGGECCFPRELWDDVGFALQFVSQRVAAAGRAAEARPVSGLQTGGALALGPALGAPRLGEATLSLSVSNRRRVKTRVFGNAFKPRAGAAALRAPAEGSQAPRWCPCCRVCEPQGLRLATRRVQLGSPQVDPSSSRPRYLLPET